jgi:hypothetical protein
VKRVTIDATRTTARLSRRNVLAAAVHAGGAVVAAGAAATAAAQPARPAGGKTTPSRRLDLRNPVDNVTAYLKLRASIETQDVWFWFTGRLDLAVAGEPIRPMINVETLILRRTERVGDLAWNVTDWEASLYRHPETGEYLDAGVSLVNPHTKRAVRPLDYREGPVRFRFTDREPRMVGSRDVMPNTGKMFNYPWSVVAGDLYMTKSSYIKAPNWLQPAEWLLESSGPEVVVAGHSVLKAPLAEVENVRVTAARADFSYTATSGWLPWMLMGTTPGFVVWAEAGRKLLSIDEAPAAQVERLRRVHPQFFLRPEPWPEFTNMYLQYKASRVPEKPA